MLKAGPADELDPYWRSVFDTYRMEVVRAGFGVWDAAAIEGLEPPQPEIERFKRYADQFVAMLGAYEPETAGRLVEQIGGRVVTPAGSRVSRVVVETVEGRRKTLHDRRRRGGQVARFKDLNEWLFSAERFETDEDFD